MQHDTTLDALGWEQRSMLAQQAGRHYEAMSCFERALDQSERALSWLGMALSQLDLKRRDEAASSLRRAATLAPAMIGQSQRRGIYDSLHQGEIHAVLATLPDASFDLVLAADTLIYIGDIDALTGAVARILKPGGSFLFTVETGTPGSGFRLTSTGRYSHAEAYIHAIAGDRLTVADHADGMLRVEAGKFTEGRAWRLARPQQPDA